MLSFLLPFALAADPNIAPPAILVAPPPGSTAPTAPMRAEEARPWVGIGLAAGSRGVAITRIYPDSAAETAGLRAGDEVLAIDGGAVTTVQALQTAIRAKNVGDDVTLVVLRDGAEATVTLALRAKPDDLKLLQGRLLGNPVLPFALPTSKGPHPADSEALRGNVVVLELFATWCGPCRASMPKMVAWHDAYAARGLRIVSVSSEDWATELQPFLADHPVPYTVAMDVNDRVGGEVVGSGKLPTIVVIDRAGVVRYVGIGSGSTLAEAERVFVPLLD